jgi:hypothetical protein
MTDVDTFEEINFVGWGGRLKSLTPNVELGVGVMPAQRSGLRRALWDAAFGYVNGFPIRDILYFVLTRDMGRWVWHRTFLRENPGGILRDSAGQPWARGGCSFDCRPCRERLTSEGDL